MIKISVCLASYNGAKYIKSQIHSILIQLNQNDELIISDDSSQDGSIEIIKSFKDPRIKLFENKRFRNPIYNFEFALKQATGKYIFLSDQDDIWHPDKIKCMLNYLSFHNMVVSDCYLINDNGEIIGESYYNLVNSNPGIIKNILINSYLGCCMAFNRELLVHALPFPDNTPMHDIWLGQIAEIYGNPIFIKEKLIYFRRHMNNASYTATKSKNNYFKRFQYRYHLILNLILRTLRTKVYSYNHQ